MISIVQAYIFHRTEKKVDINIVNDADYIKLIKAYNIATEWFANNNGKITKI
jgi:hypothetical protein